MTENTSNTQQISKYNSAVAQLFRLDELWKDAHRHSRSGNYMAWNADLDKIWSELAGDLKPNCNEEKEYNTFTQQLGKAGTLSKDEIKGFNSNSNFGKPTQYIVLLNKEIWLRRLQNSQGKGTAYADEFEDDFD